ncbi:MAG: hypothetical protein KatS3mg031_0634 [Chitinophagales bacterium]|nr:MAG: hypothetical protein KatS3mg031_0634 [Chitinophagales bacterium]
MKNYLTLCFPFLLLLLSVKEVLAQQQDSSREADASHVSQAHVFSAKNAHQASYPRLFILDSAPQYTRIKPDSAVLPENGRIRFEEPSATILSNKSYTPPEPSAPR